MISAALRGTLPRFVSASLSPLVPTSVFLGPRLQHGFLRLMEDVLLLDHQNVLLGDSRHWQRAHSPGRSHCLRRFVPSPHSPFDNHFLLQFPSDQYLSIMFHMLTPKFSGLHPFGSIYRQSPKPIHGTFLHAPNLPHLPAYLLRPVLCMAQDIYFVDQGRATVHDAPHLTLRYSPLCFGLLLMSDCLFRTLC